MDIENTSIRFKRHALQAEMETVDTGDDLEGTQSEENLLDKVYDVLEKIGRKQDFAMLLEVIASGVLPTTNIALHLLLDIGKFFRHGKVNAMRYNDISLNFWTVVMKMFKLRGVRFFRGFMGDGLKDKVNEG